VSDMQTLRLSDVYALEQDRKKFDDSELNELAASIGKHGLAQPITVRPGDSGRYVIVAGERRFRAHHILGLTSINAIVRNDMSDEQHAAIQLIENVQRSDLDPMDEARAYKARMDKFGFSVEQLSEWSGKSVGVIRKRLELLNLAPEFVTMLQSGDLAVSHCQEVARLDVNRQRLAIKALGEGKGLSFWQFQKLCEQLWNEQCQDSMFDPDAFLRVAEYQQQARKASVIRVRDLVSALENVMPVLKPLMDVECVVEALGVDGAARMAEFVDIAEHAINTRGTDKASKGSSADKLKKKRG